MAIRISSRTVATRWRHLQALDEGAVFRKVDLHVHTPASGDATWSSRYDFEFDPADFDGSWEAAAGIADAFVARAVDQQIRLVAVTDHNCPATVTADELGRTWYQLLYEAAERYGAGAPCILPGIEISTDDMHVLVILDPDQGAEEDETPQRRAVRHAHHLNALLRRCGFAVEDYGRYQATGGGSLHGILRTLDEFDLRALVIPAHVDSGHKAILDLYGRTGGLWAKLAAEKRLVALEFTVESRVASSTLETSSGTRLLAPYLDGLRDGADLPRLGWVTNSDGHSLKDSGLGRRFSWVKMGEPSYAALANAFKDRDTRVAMKEGLPPVPDHARIVGYAWRKEGDDWRLARMSRDLTCLIGRRGTWKSTAVDLLLWTLDRVAAADDAAITERLGAEGYAGMVFLEADGKTWCAGRRPGDAATRWYALDGTSWSSCAAPDIPLPRKYVHDEVAGRVEDPSRLMEFLDWRVLPGDDPAWRAALDRRNAALDAARASGFTAGSPELAELTAACEAVCDARRDLTAVQARAVSGGYVMELLDYRDATGDHLFEVTVKPGKRAGSRTEDWLDRPSLKVREPGVGMRAFNRLPVGRRNAWIMILLMQQETFGPLIVDEPERHLDVASMLDLFIPRLRLRKGSQQVLVVTNHDWVLVDGAAEQVWVAESEQRFEVLTGDCNDFAIQREVMEIFQGDTDGRHLRAKTARLEGLMT